MSDIISKMTDKDLVREWNNTSQLVGTLGAQDAHPIKVDYLKRILNECRKRNILV